MGESITKHDFLTALSCPTRAFYQRTQVASPPTPGDEVRMLEGLQVGEMARGEYPEGILVTERDPVSAARVTRELMEDPKVSVLFEAAFIASPFVTRVDVLRRTQGGWTMVEVKSSAHKEDEISADHVHDMAYTTMVLTMCGVPVTAIELMRLSKAWAGRVGEPFRTVDTTERIREQVSLFSEIAPSVASHILGGRIPPATLMTGCKNCEFFTDMCLGKGIEYPIVEIPRISGKKLLELTALGVKDVREVPKDYDLTSTQKGMVECIQSGEAKVNKSKLSKHLLLLTWPCYYLDFETATSALPLWEGVPPFEQVLTQYSLHISNHINDDPQHREYLAPITHDARRELAERLIADLGLEGSIIVYSSFEKTQIKGLADKFPDLAAALMLLSERLFDLEVIFKEAVCHPEFRGRTSIKVTLPTLVPDMSYKDLLIGGGDTAVAAFVRMVRGWCSDEEVAQLRAALLAYCKQDTLAMVKLHRAVAGFVG